MTKRKPLTLIAVGAALTLALAACGSSSSSTPSSSPSQSGSSSVNQAQKDAAAAKQAIQPYLTEPTKIDNSAPLTKKPQTGKIVYWLTNTLETGPPLTAGYEAAAKTLGWKLKVLSFDATDPQGPSAVMQQAIQGKADYIAISGENASALGASLEQAKQAKIPVGLSFATDVPGGASTGIYSDPGSSEYTKEAGQVLANWVINDSGGKAHVLFVNDPDFAILKTVGSQNSDFFKSNCKECDFKSLDISTSDLVSGKTASDVISRLQSDPSINYVDYTIGPLAIGLPQALASAGLADKVKLVGSDPGKVQVQDLIGKNTSALSPLPNTESAWMVMDVFARLSLGMDSTVGAKAKLPVWLWTQDNVPTPAALWDGSQGYADQYKALWKVS